MPNFHPFTVRGSAAMTVARTGLAVVLAAAAAAGCSDTKKSAPVNYTAVLPADYRNQIATYLSQVLIDRADFMASFIGTPVLEQVGDNQHYVVCVQLNGHNQHKDKVAIYLGALINQFVDAQPNQCANAAYQPFTELAALLPRK
jgi:hypothetical protein